MIKAAGHLNDLYRDSEEAQRLLLNRKVTERQLRKQRIEEAEERARRDEEAIKRALAAAEEQKKAEILRQMKEEQQRAEEALQKKLAEEEAARLEEERRAEEERQKERQRILEAERQAEAERKAEERRKQVEAEKARQEEEARERVRFRLLEVVQCSGSPGDIDALRSAITDGLAAGLESELEPAQKAFRGALIASLGEVVKSRDMKALRTAIADAESLGDLEDELVPVRKALEDELALRKAATLKARKAKEELAAQFKDANEAQAFGGAILAAQWRAAVREVSKPSQE